MRKIFMPVFSLIFMLNVAGQKIDLPKDMRTYDKVTSYNELSEKVLALDKQSEVLNVEIIGHSVEGRNIFALKFSNTEFGKDRSKIKVLIFAQQHGNEQSGKEGALLLAEALANPNNAFLFDKMDLALIPQVNPDGSEVNRRRNANDADLNRNHLILTEPETNALHQFFDSWLFEVTMDVHEYSPYSESWLKNGYRKNSLVTVGATTNLNVSEKIRNLSKNEVLPYLQNYIQKAGFSSFTYCPGGPPETDYLRYSTFDINDGRQSLGIQNSLSFIQEGMNGKDDFLENMQARAYSQMTGMFALLDYVYLNDKKITKLIHSQRKKLTRATKNELVSIQMQHIKNGEKIHLPVLSLESGNDSIIISENFNPVVKSLHDVQKPDGYLIPADCKKLVDWAKRHALITTEYHPSNNLQIEQYLILGVDSIDFEGDIVVNPQVEKSIFTGKAENGEFIYIPLNQLKSNLIVAALEPKSILGLVTYLSFQDLLEIGKVFPVRRVVKK